MGGARNKDMRHEERKVRKDEEGLGRMRMDGIRKEGERRGGWQAATCHHSRFGFRVPPPDVSGGYLDM